MNWNAARLDEFLRSRAGSDLTIARCFFIGMRRNNGIWLNQCVYDVGSFGRPRCKRITNIHDDQLGCVMPAHDDALLSRKFSPTSQGV